MKKFFVMMLFLLGICSVRGMADTDLSNYNDVIYIKSGTVVAPGDQATVSVCLKNTTLTAVPAFQFDLVLPEGITVVSAKKSTARIENPSEDDHTVSKAVQTDGSVRFIGSSNTNTLFTGTDGEIMTITLEASDEMSTGDVSLSLKNEEITNMVEGSGVGTQVSGPITTTLAVGNPYAEGYAVKILPFEINTSDESTSVDVFVNVSKSAKSVSFNLLFSNSDFTNKGLVTSTSERGCTINTNADGSYSFVVSKTTDFTLNDNVKIATLKIYSKDEGGTYTLPTGLYSIAFSNIEFGDGTNTYKVAPSSTSIMVGSTITPDTEGQVEISGDFSNDATLATKVINAIPATNESLTIVDLTQATGLTLTDDQKTALNNRTNPNALIETAEDLGLNKKNVVINGTCETFEMADGKPFNASKKFTATSAKYSRTMENTWGTICLPYNVKSKDGEVAYYNIEKLENNTLYLTKIDELAAGTPALVKKLTDGQIAPTSTSVKVSANTSEPTATGDVTMHGCFSATPIVDDATTTKYFIANNKFYHANTTVTVNPFRAYFTVSSQNARDYITINDPDDTVTAINALAGESDVKVEGIFDASGKQLPDLQDGLNIVKLSNGKVQKIMVK